MAKTNARSSARCRTRTSRRATDQLLYTALAEVGKALASPVRVQLLDILSQGGRTVEELARESGQSIANTSQHLQALLRSRLVTRTKSGLYVHYELARAEVGDLVRAVRLTAESGGAELLEAKRRLLAGLDEADEVDREKLVRRVHEGDAFVIDVRPHDEYRAGHVPGARCVPLEELEKTLAKLPRRREIVAYCRGPYCVLSVEAVRRLREKGYRARHMDLGVWDWRALGLPVESGTPEGDTTR